jgi:hypothetical protein
VESCKAVSASVLVSFEELAPAKPERRLSNLFRTAQDVPDRKQKAFCDIRSWIRGCIYRPTYQAVGRLHLHKERNSFCRRSSGIGAWISFLCISQG